MPLKKVNKHEKCQQRIIIRHRTDSSPFIAPLGIMNLNWWKSLCIIISLVINFCDCIDPVSVSQISPKSEHVIINEHSDDLIKSLSSTKTYDNLNEDDLNNISTVEKREDTNFNDNSHNSNQFNRNGKQSPDEAGQQRHQREQKNERHQHIRIERSASPILNDATSSKIHFNLVNDFKEFEKNDVEDGAGRRYFDYIKPTSTLNHVHENPEITKSNQRMGKDLFASSSLSLSSSSPLTTTESTSGSELNSEDDSFLSIGGPRSVMSGSPAIKPTTVSQVSAAVTSTSVINDDRFPHKRYPPHPNGPRQNSNPDIQDIITGIVKLLNGNVNVHANTQVAAHRRPIASRINNRGPPRINEAQPLPIDYEHQKPPGGIMHPPPYLFDRPESPVRPFITGVPIPEQIVPSMQQNYRPAFISQNRPPWHRPRPRPPITGNRRPIPPYKPLPSYHQEYRPEEDVQITTMEAENGPVSNETLELTPETGPSLTEGDLPQEEEFENESTKIPSLVSQVPSFSAPTVQSEIDPEEDLPYKKEEYPKKKDTKIKSSEKKPIITKSTTSATPDVTTIIQSTSVVNTAQVISSTITTTFNKLEDFSPTTSVEASIDDQTTSNMENTSYMESSTLLSSTTHITSSTEDVIAPTPELSSTQLESSQSSIKTTSPLQLPSSSDHSSNNKIVESSTQTPTIPYHPRPGIVLDDPEFKPGGHKRPPLQQRPQRPQILPTQSHHLPPGYGEIFDVTLSAIQGPGSSGSQQTINIKPYGSYNNNGINLGDIIISPSGDEGFVSIDGKRTYINLFGESTEAPISHSNNPTEINVLNESTSFNSGNIGTGYAVPDTQDILPHPTETQMKSHVQATQIPSQRPHYRPRTTQPPVRIDTCIVGDDSTCDQAQNERCKTENGVSSCHCRPGYSRRKHREPCRKVVSFLMSLRVDKIYERRIIWDKAFLDRDSDAYTQLSFESSRAIDSAMSMTPFSDEFMEARVNNIYQGDASQGNGGVFVNLTLRLEENGETLRTNIRNDIQKHLLGVLHRRNNNIGNSILYVDSPPGSISNLQDLDECQSRDLNDCHPSAICSNIWGSFRCECEKGYRDPWSDQPQRAGRDCISCPETYCNNRGICSYELDGTQVCTCDGSYYGSQCEIDGEVLGVAIGASLAAVIIIVLTLVCLIMWSRKWQREQKNAIGSPVFGYMTTGPVKGATMGQSQYQVTLEDRMRWAQIADVMAQANHYAAEPVAPTRPSSALFGYPNLQALNISTLGGMSINGSHPVHSGQMPPVPLPRRLGIGGSSSGLRSNGMRTLENSSSSEEEDRTDLLGRNFQVPRPKSRSNGSIANQSGIYYDVDYEPSGGGGSTDIYGGTTQTTLSSSIPGPQGIPMSTYTSGRAQSSYYMK